MLKAIWPEGEDTALMVALFSAAIHDYEHKGLNVCVLMHEMIPLGLRLCKRVLCIHCPTN